MPFRHLAPMVLAALLAGCGTHPVAPAAVAYLCPDGQRFSARFAADGESASVEFHDMQFPLLKDRGQPGSFSCSMLTLRREGPLASLKLEGQPHFTACRELAADDRR